MWFEDIYIKFNNKLEINTIYSYKIIMKIFVNKYVKKNSNNYSDKKLLLNDAILYSKYYLYYKIFVILRLLNPEIKEKVLDKAYYSLITIAISGTVWVSTELTCNYVKNAVLLVGHPMWHFFIGHGFYNLIQVVYFIKLNNTKYELKYNSLYLLKREPDIVDFL